MKTTLLIFLNLLFSTTVLYAQNWVELGQPGTGSNQLYEESRGISDICTDPSGNVYVAVVNDTPQLQICFVYKWDGTSWSRLGGPNVQPFNADIKTLCSDSIGNIYAAGDFTDSSGNFLYQVGKQYVAKWDGTSWNELGTGVNALNANGTIYSLCFDHNGNLYAAGVFTDSTNKCYIAKWNGISWTKVGSLNTNNVINSMCFDNDNNLYAAGGFSNDTIYYLGNLYVAKWDGNSWTEFGDPLSSNFSYDNQIFSILADAQNNIYIGGHFYNTDSTAEDIAKWNGTSWQSVGSGVNGYVFDMSFDPMGNLYIAGDITDSTTGDYAVMKWNGSSWTEPGAGNGALNANNDIGCISSDLHGNIYVAGDFTDTTITFSTYSNPPNPNYVAKYNNPSAYVTPVNAITGVTVYPNPANDAINIGINNSGSDIIGSNYFLYDVTGKTCRSGTIKNDNTSISISDLPNGIYTLSVGNSSSGAYTIVKK